MTRRNDEPMTLLRALRESLGVEVAATAFISAVQSDRKLGARVLAAAAEWESVRPPPPECRADEVRPYIDTLWSAIGGGVGNPSGRYEPSERYVFNPAGHEVFGGGSNPDVAVTAVKRQLLYCHGLALENPFPMTFMAPEPPHWQLAQLLVQAPLRLLAALAPLVDAGVVSILPMNYDDGTSFGNEASMLVDAGNDPLGALPPPMGVDRLQPEEREVAIQVLGYFLGRTFGMIKQADGQVDLYLPSTPCRDLLKVLLDHGLKVEDEDSVVDLRYLPELFAVDLPRLDALSLNDVVAIRRDGYFEEWRNALRDGLAGAGQLPPDELFPQTAKLQEIQGQLRDVGRRAEDELNQSRLTARIRAAAPAGIPATVAVGVAVATGAEIIAPAAAGLVVLGQVLVEWLRGTRRKAGAQSLARHISVFNTDEQ